MGGYHINTIGQAGSYSICSLVCLSLIGFWSYTRVWLLNLKNQWSSTTRMLTITASKDKTANLTSLLQNCILIITVEWQSENYNKKCNKNERNKWQITIINSIILLLILWTFLLIYLLILYLGPKSRIRIDTLHNFIHTLVLSLQVFFLFLPFWYLHWTRDLTLH